MGRITVEKNVAGISGLCVITPTLYGDSRGYFMETYNQHDLEETGIEVQFVQDNQAMSTRGVLRGLHFQLFHPQTKLVRVLHGTVFDVTVDLRRNSRTFGCWHGEILSDDNKRQVLVPAGFAHGYLVLSETAEFCYKCDDYYHPEDEGGLAWNDPQVGIVWPGISGTYGGSASAAGYTVDGQPLLLNERDQRWPGIRTLQEG